MLWRLAALLLLFFPIAAASAFADTFSYTFLDDGFNTPLSFTFISSVLITTDTKFTPLTCTYVGSPTCTLIDLNPGKKSAKTGGYTSGTVTFYVTFADGSTGSTSDPVALDLGKVGTQTYVYGGGKAKGGGMQTVAILNIPSSVAPEPSSIALLGTGLLGSAAFARRRLVERTASSNNGCENPRCGQGREVLSPPNRSRLFLPNPSKRSNWPP